MNQYTKMLSEEAYEMAKLRRSVLRARAIGAKEKAEYLEKRAKQYRADYHRLIKEANKPLWEIIKNGK